MGLIPLYLNLLVMGFQYTIFILSSFLVLYYFFFSLAYFLGSCFRDNGLTRNNVDFFENSNAFLKISIKLKKIGTSILTPNGSSER